MAWPIALRLISEQLLAFVDTAAAGHVGIVPLAAIALGTSTFLTLIWPLGGLVKGISVLGSRAAGAHDVPLLARIMRAGSIMPLAVAGIATVALAALGPVLMHAIVQDTHVASEAALYLQVRALGLVPFTLTTILALGVAASGDSRLTFRVFVAMSAVHVPLLVILGLADPAHIVAITAWASLLGDLAGAAYAVVATIRSPLSLALRFAPIDRFIETGGQRIDAIRQTGAIAWPEGLNLLALLIPEPLTMSILNTVSLVAVGANQILCIANDTTNAAPWSLADASEILFGHRIGARQQRALDALQRRFQLVSLTICGVLAVLAVALARPIATFFSSNHEVVTLGALALACHIGATLPLKGIGAIQEARLYALGDTRFIMATGIIGGILALALIFIGVSAFHIGVFAVPIAWSIVWIARVAASRVRIRYLVAYPPLRSLLFAMRT